VKSVSNEGKHDGCECGVLKWVVKIRCEITCGGIGLVEEMSKREGSIRAATKANLEAGDHRSREPLRY
jgi:hypothetical protein